MKKASDILKQIKSANSQNPLSATQGLSCASPEPGQLHQIRFSGGKPACYSELFFYIVEQEGFLWKVIPGSLDGLMAGPDDIVLPKTVLGQYVFLSVETTTLVPENAIGNGFARLDEATCAKIRASLEKSQGGYPHALPYISGADSRRAYHQQLDEIVQRARGGAQQTVIFEKPRVKKSRLKYFSYAASILFLCGLSWLFWRSNPVENNWETETQGGRNYAPMAQSVSRSSKDALAYLVDSHGKVQIVDANGAKRTPASCEVLYKGDVVVLADQARAKVMYPDACFDVSAPVRSKEQLVFCYSPAPQITTADTNNPMQYRIDESALVALDMDNSVMTTLEPTATARELAMVVPPRDLLTPMPRAITRAGNEEINVYSPKGASYTDQPVVKIGGDPNLTYTVSILDWEGTVIGKSVTMKGNTRQVWTNFTNSPIAEDEIYTLRVQRDGKIVNDINNASFWLLSKQEQKKMSVALKYVDSIESAQDRAFFRANVFYKNGCYSEAHGIVEELAIKNPHSTFYKKLAEMCKILLKIK